MIKKLFFVGLLFTLSARSNRCFSQDAGGHAIQVGDALPNFPFSFYIGDSLKNGHLADYKTNLIIFDFWGVHCPDCIAGLPHMVNLQKEFGSKIKIFVVTQDKKKDIDQLWVELAKYSTKAKELKAAASALPFIVGDSLINSLIKHKGNPIHVWIDSNLIFRNLTYAATTVSKNVKAFLANKPVLLAEQRILNIHRDDPLSWLLPDSLIKNHLQFYSFIFNRIEFGNIPSGLAKIVDTTNRVIGLAAMNQSILQLYKLACFDGGRAKTPTGFVQDNNILIEAKDSNKLYYPNYYDSNFFNWADKNTYCYALKIQPSSITDAYRTMQNDLDRFFNYKSAFEIRKMRCLVLKINLNKKKQADTTQETAGDIIADSGKLFLVLRNVPSSTLAGRIRDVIYQHNRFMPFIDETHYQKTDIILSWNEDQSKMSIPDLANELHKNGFELIEEERDLKMLVIKDAP